jgi:PEP-CTERM motif
MRNALFPWFRLLSVPLLALGICCLQTPQTRAALTEVSVQPIVNADLNTYTAGFNYPPGGTALTVGGIPFTLATFPDGSGDLGVFQTSGPGSLVGTLSTSIYGASTVYTLMNSAFGTFGDLNGMIEFFGTGGAYAEFDIIQGTNIRDHYFGFFNNIIAPGTPNVTYGDGLQFSDTVRLDRQTFVLPSIFHTETLTSIVLTSFDHGGDGEPFLAAVTVAPVPEPSTFMVAAGATVFGLCVRRRRAIVA